MRLGLLIIVLGFACSARLAAQAPNTAPAGNVENGKKLWVTRACFQCHGNIAQGAQDSAPRLARRDLSWSYFLKYLRQPTLQMVPYTAKVLPDQEAADIYAWIKTIPAPPPVSSIPALKDLK